MDKKLKRMTSDMRKIVKAAEYLRTKRGKANLLNSSREVLNQALDSPLRVYTLEVLARTFQTSIYEIVNGPRKLTPIEKMSPSQRAIQKAGFHEGAKVPGSKIRKIDR